jgi:hypothetical protein
MARLREPLGILAAVFCLFCSIVDLSVGEWPPQLFCIRLLLSLMLSSLLPSPPPLSLSHPPPHISLSPRKVLAAPPDDSCTFVLACPAFVAQDPLNTMSLNARVKCGAKRVCPLPSLFTLVALRAYQSGAGAPWPWLGPGPDEGERDEARFHPRLISFPHIPSCPAYAVVYLAIHLGFERTRSRRFNSPCNDNRRIAGLKRRHYNCTMPFCNL